jgi:diacylglycerol O-acyltransferase
MSVPTPMSAQDALWLTMDRPTNLMIIDGVLILAGRPGYDAVLDTVRTRVSGRFPVFRRKPVRSGAGWAWQDDPAFDASRHVKRVQLPEPADIPALHRFMSGQRAKTLPRNRPLWVVFVVDRVRLDDGTIGSAIVCRFHHAMADGVRLTQVMLSMCDSDTQQEGNKPAVGALVSRRGPAGALPLPVPLPAPVASILGIAFDTAKAVGQGLAGAAELAAHVAVSASIAATDVVMRALTNPIDAVSSLPGAAAAAPRVAWYLIRYGAETVDEGITFAVHPSRLADALTLLGEQDNRAVNDASSVTKLLLSQSSQTLWSREPGTNKAIAWSSPLSLPGLKAISRSQHATVNDVMLAAVAGGVQRYLELHDAQARQIQWLVPVNLKPFADNLPEDLGNYFALVMLPMPLGITDHRARIRDMKAHMERIKHSDEAVLTFGLQQAMSVSPGKAQVFLTNFFANKTVGVLTNVPGPTDLLRFAGTPVLQIVGFAPCSGNQPIAATIFSYNDTVTIGFATDAGLIPDPDVLVDLVAQETQAMRTLVPRLSPAAGTSRTHPRKVSRAGP